MRAYVQQQNGQWLNDNCYTAWYGLTRMGYEVHPFTKEKIPTDISKNVVTHGGINTMREIFDLLNTQQPPIHNPQDHLLEYCKREFNVITWEDTINNQKYPFFIKPAEDHKLFTGYVVKNFMDKVRIQNLPKDTKILMSEYKNFVSEYRCFINRGNLVGSKNYTGDFTKNIDYGLVNDAIKNYKEQPISYSLDFALTDEGETMLIEINDGFALGSYGLNPITYTRMIINRWNEIMGKSVFI